MFVGLLIYLLVVFLVIIITREIWCWLLKTTKIVELLKGIHTELKATNRMLERMQPPGSEQFESAGRKCPNCEATVAEDAEVCFKCGATL